MSGRPLAVVAGYAIRFPVGGMTWVYLNHLLGLAQLGFDVAYVEAALWPGSCYDPVADEVGDDPAVGLAHLAEAAAHVGLDDLVVSYVDDAGTFHGPGRDELEGLLARAAVLVNVGATTWHEAWSAVDRRILVDCDAPFTQLALHRGTEPLRGIAANHDVWATIAPNVAEGRCDGIPLDRPWVRTRPPIHTAAWTPSPVPEAGPWSTITSWGSTARDRWAGEDLGNKADAYASLLDLPRRVAVDLELPVSSDAPVDLLSGRGWHVVDPVPRTATVADVVAHVHASRGELAVAKAAYATVRTGAVNDRSLCWMAAGRPVVTSDVGAVDVPADAAGYRTFHDAAGAARAIAEVESDHAHHAAAARRLVEERFEAADVLADLLVAADVAVPDREPAP